MTKKLNYLFSVEGGYRLCNSTNVLIREVIETETGGLKRLKY